MTMTLAEIAERVNGSVLGDGTRQISGVAPFEAASPNDISFAADAAFVKQLDRSQAGALLVPQGCKPAARDLVVVENPRAAFAVVMALFHPPKQPEMGISDRACLGENFSHGEDVSIAPFVFIGRGVSLGRRVHIMPSVFIGDGVSVGDDVTIESNASILERCVIGNRVIIHAGTVIGSDGFGFVFDGKQHLKIPQTGNVVIGDDVEIGANNTIDRGTFGATRIESGVKTDNLVHVAHNVQVGRQALLVAQVGISGSVTIGERAIIAGQAGIAQHLAIGDRAIIGPQSGIAKSVAPGEIVSGSPGMPHRNFLKVQRIVQKLPELKKAVTELERRLDEIEKLVRAR